MKNLIILILAAATIFLTWKTYFSNNQCCSTSSNNNGTSVEVHQPKFDTTGMNYFKGRTDNEMNINLYDVVSNFRTFTLTQLKDKDNVDGIKDRTDGLVTKSISYDRVKLLQLLNASNSQNVIFHLGSLDRLSASKYNNFYKIGKKGSVVQKPILILEIDTLNKDRTGSTKVFAIGKICPPPNNCP
ncbi:MAG: hypothetical protein M9958_04105 [Chitinophagales bacterium]|nr:hypothetical protein [Chitinophagales bacterium]